MQQRVFKLAVQTTPSAGKLGTSHPDGDEQATRNCEFGEQEIMVWTGGQLR